VRQVFLGFLPGSQPEAQGEGGGGQSPDQDRGGVDFVAEDHEYGAKHGAENPGIEPRAALAAHSHGRGRAPGHVREKDAKHTQNAAQEFDRHVGHAPSVTQQVWHNERMSLMDEIRHYSVARGTAALWWLGQNGFIFKTAGGTVIAADLYLSNSCAAVAPPGMDLGRQVPVLIPPEEIDVDVYVCTHSHQDHADPETIGRLRHRDTMRFIGPHQACDVFRRCGIESGRIEATWPDHTIEAGDITLRATFAMPTDDTDLNHVGYVFSFGGGPRVYMTGDTAACELLGAARKHEPHAMIACINGGFRNLSHEQAALLAAEIRPRVAIPCHYDMFPDNAADPRQFQAMLKLRAPEVHYAAPRHGEVLVLER